MLSSYAILSKLSNSPESVCSSVKRAKVPTHRVAASFITRLLSIYLKTGTVPEAQDGVEDQRDKVSVSRSIHSNVLQIQCTSTEQSIQEVLVIITSHLLFLSCFGPGSHTFIRSDTDPQGRDCISSSKVHLL